MTDCGAVMDVAISQWGSLFPSAAAWTSYPSPANLPHEGRSREGSHYQPLLLTRGSGRLRVLAPFQKQESLFLVQPGLEL